MGKETMQKYLTQMMKFFVIWLTNRSALTGVNLHFFFFFSSLCFFCFYLLIFYLFLGLAVAVSLFYPFAFSG